MLTTSEPAIDVATFNKAQEILSKNRVGLPAESEKNLIECQANDAGKKLARTHARTIQERSLGMSVLWQLLCIQGDGCAQKREVKGRIREQ